MSIHSSTSLGVALVANIIVGNSNSIDTSLSNSCAGKEDGSYWLQLLNDDNYMPLYLTCHNEHIILDLNKDSNLENYFSSYELWHTHLAGPSNSDPVNWNDWFLPSYYDASRYSDDNAEEPSTEAGGNFYISPDCTQCELDAIRQVHDEETSYWMTGNLAKLHWPVIGFNECDMDYNTYACYDCTECMLIGTGCEPTVYSENTTYYEKAGLCGVAVQAATKTTYHQRRIAQQTKKTKNFKPSIGTEGDFCVCYQPNTLNSYELSDKQITYIAQNKDSKENSDNNSNENENVSENVSKNKKIQMQQRSENKKNEQKYVNIDQKTADMRDENVVYLSQSDFEQGTYRIKESGTYKLTEDITFDFNKDDDYWPRNDQSDVYPGARAYRDAYHLGFFAGITIECDYVTIDLNGHEMKMSLEFYYQQRWFAIIELGNQQFLPGQGPAYFGNDPQLIEDITIQNGVLGRTSHFGIHGNFPTNLVIKDLHIRHFVTHGLQLNGWENLEMDNIEIGPSSQIEYLRGDYGHARIIIDRLKAIAEDMADQGRDINKETIQFGNHGNLKRKDGNTLNDIIENLEFQMSVAYDYALNRNAGEYTDNNYVNPELLELSGKNEEDLATWQDVKDQFIQESGLPASSSITGLFLNFYGASVFSYTMYTTHQSNSGSLSNIYIHDIYHDMVESMRIGKTGFAGQVYPTPWNSDIPAERMFGTKQQLVDFYNLLNNDNLDDTEMNEYLNDNFKYYGSVMTDAFFAMDHYSDSWDYLGFLQTDIKDDSDTTVLDWVNGKTYDIAQDGGVNPLTDWRLGCNQDIMGHSGKGLLGMRIDGVNDLTLSNIRVENLHEHGAVGSDACGEYFAFDAESNGGHFKQTKPMQNGFSGNNLQAISIISSTNVYIKDSIVINNIENDYSLAFGLSMWTANDISIDADTLIMVNNVVAGSKLELGTFDYDSLPNQSPEACATRLEISDQSDLYESYITIEDNGAANVIACNVNGHVTCLNEDSSSMYGNYFDDSSVCENIDTIDDLRSFISQDIAIRGDKINNGEKQDSLFLESNGMENKIKTKVSGDFKTIAIVLAVVFSGFAFVIFMLHYTGKTNKYSDSWSMMCESDKTFYYRKVRMDDSNLNYGSV